MKKIRSAYSREVGNAFVSKAEHAYKCERGGTLIKGLSSVVPEAGRARQEAGRCGTPLL